MFIYLFQGKGSYMTSASHPAHSMYAPVWHPPSPSTAANSNNNNNNNKNATSTVNSNSLSSPNNRSANFYPPNERPPSAYPRGGSAAPQPSPSPSVVRKGNFISIHMSNGWMVIFHPSIPSSRLLDLTSPFEAFSSPPRTF